MQVAKLYNWLRNLAVRFSGKPAECGVVFLGCEPSEQPSPGRILGTIGSSGITAVEAIRMASQFTPEERKSHKQIFGGGTSKLNRTKVEWNL